MKVNNFLKDVTGAMRVTNARRKLIAGGDDTRPYADHIADLAHEVHPESTRVRVTAVTDASPSARTFTFVACGGDVLPPFEAGQYVSFDLDIDGTLTTRPFSISSAPFEARQGEDSFFQVTVRNGKPGVGFVSCWMYDTLAVGDELTCHLPFGTFFVEPLRDTKQVVALAGGSGITPFLSMAREVAHGTLDVDLTILYGSVTADDIVLRDELEAVCGDHVRLVNVISGDEDFDGEKGYLSADLIRRHSPADPASGDVTYFVCGPLAMYSFVRGELAGLGVPDRRVRMEVFGAPRDVTQAEGYPADFAPATFQLTVRRGQQADVIEAASTEPILVALERAGIPTHSRCRSGECAYCRCRLNAGDVFVPAEGDGRRWADKKFGYVHACSTWPLSDCEIEVPII